MRNKPNFRKTQMNLTSFLTTNYEQRTMNYEVKNKPNSNPIKPNLSRRSLWRRRIYPGGMHLEDFLIYVAVGGLAGLFVIILVILLRGPEFPGGNQLSLYIVALFPELPDEIFGDLLLPLVHIKNHGAILPAHIGALAIELSEIVGLKVKLCELFKIGFCRIKNNLDCLGVAGLVGADLLVCGIIHLAARIADCCRDNAGSFLKMIFGTPETAGRKYRGVGLLILGGDKIHRDRIHAIAGVLRRKALAQKDMAQMAIALCAENFGTTPVRIRLLPYRRADLVVEARPAATGFELRRRFKKPGAAAPAGVNAFFVMFIIFAAEGRLGSLVNDNSLFFRTKFSVHGIFLIKAGPIKKKICYPVQCSNHNRHSE